MFVTQKQRNVCWQRPGFNVQLTRQTQHGHHKAVEMNANAPHRAAETPTGCWIDQELG